MYSQSIIWDVKRFTCCKFIDIHILIIINYRLLVDYSYLYPLTNNGQIEYTKSVQIYVTNHILDQNPSVCWNAEILVIIKAIFTKFGIQVAIYPMPIKLITIIVCHVHRPLKSFITFYNSNSRSRFKCTIFDFPIYIASTYVYLS